MKRTFFSLWLCFILFSCVAQQPTPVNDAKRFKKYIIVDRSITGQRVNATDTLELKGNYFTNSTTGDTICSLEFMKNYVTQAVITGVANFGTDSVYNILTILDQIRLGSSSNWIKKIVGQNKLSVKVNDSYEGFISKKSYSSYPQLETFGLNYQGLAKGGVMTIFSNDTSLHQNGDTTLGLSRAAILKLILKNRGTGESQGTDSTILIQSNLFPTGVFSVKTSSISNGEVRQDWHEKNNVNHLHQLNIDSTGFRWWFADDNNRQALIKYSLVTKKWEFGLSPTDDSGPDSVFNIRYYGANIKGTLAVSSLSGTGTRYVTANAGGVLGIGGTPSGTDSLSMTKTLVMSDSIPVIKDGKLKYYILSQRVTTASDSVRLTDLSQTIYTNCSGANTLMIRTNATVPMPINAVVNVIQYGAGQTTITFESTVTGHSTAGFKLNGQYAGCSLQQKAINEWIIYGRTTN
jgi:hypothetical protein